MSQPTWNDGWLCKDDEGLSWSSEEPVWRAYDPDRGVRRGYWEMPSGCHWRDVAPCIVDPWPKHPKGGELCILKISD